MQGDIERVEVDSGGGRPQEGGVERGGAGFGAAGGGDVRLRPGGRAGEGRDLGHGGGGLSLMRGWGAMQQVKVNPTDDAAGGGANLSVDLDRPATPPADGDEVQIRLPPPSLFFDALGGQLRHADRMDAAKQGTWRFFLLFLYSVLLTIFSVYCVTLTLQFLYGIYVPDPAATIRVLNVGTAEFNKDRMKVSSTQMVPFSVQSSNPESFRVLLAGADGATKGIYIGSQVANNFVSTTSIVTDVLGSTDITTSQSLRLNAGNLQVKIPSSKLLLGCSGISPSSDRCMSINGSIALGGLSSHTTSVAGPMSISGQLSARNVKIIGR